MANQHFIGSSRAARVLLGCVAAAVVIAQPSGAMAQAVSPKGHIAQFQITEPTRLDWIFSLAIVRGKPKTSPNNAVS